MTLCKKKDTSELKSQEEEKQAAETQQGNVSSGRQQKTGYKNVTRGDSDSSLCEAASCFYSFRQAQKQKTRHSNCLWVKEN